MSAGEKEIWEEPARGSDLGEARMRLAGLSGLEVLQAASRGQTPLAPIVYLTEILFTGISAGHTAFKMPASDWFANATGLISGGVLAMLADAPLGASIHTELPPATGYTTAELSLTMLRPVKPREGGSITASGQTIHTSRSVGLSEAFLITEPDGELVAHATSRCAIFPPLDPVPERPSELPVIEQPYPGESADDPLRRELRGEIVSPEVFESRDGADLVDAWVKGELPQPPIHHLTGLTFRDGGEGEATMTLPCSPWLSTMMGTVQGGFTAMLAEAALAGAAFTTAPAGTAVAPLDLKVNFLRPVQPDGRELTARAKVIHRGRTLAVSNARIENADGKPVALATGSAMYLEGRPADLSGVELGEAATEQD